MLKETPPEVTEFDKELHTLFDSRSVSASKIDKLKKLAFSSSKYYKNIVYCVEKFITRCVPEYKLTGLYVLDSICRASFTIKQKSSGSAMLSGGEYVGRFEKNIEALFAEFCKVAEPKDKEKVKRVVDLWERSETFSPKVLSNIKQKYFPLLGNTDAVAKVQTQPSKEVLTPPSAVATPDSINSNNDTAVASPQRSPPRAATPPKPTADAEQVDQATSIISNLAATFGNMPSQLPLPFQQQQSQPWQNGVWNPATLTGNESLTSTAGITDPSAALALQTILATVNAAKNNSNGGFAFGVPSAAAASTAPSTIPPILQQYSAGFLSSTTENGFNNNTAASLPGQMVPPSSSALAQMDPSWSTSSGTPPMESHVTYGQQPNGGMSRRDPRLRNGEGGASNSTPPATPSTAPIAGLSPAATSLFGAGGLDPIKFAQLQALLQPQTGGTGGFGPNINGSMPALNAAQQGPQHYNAYMPDQSSSTLTQQQQPPQQQQQHSFQQQRQAQEHHSNGFQHPLPKRQPLPPKPAITMTPRTHQLPSKPTFASTSPSSASASASLASQAMRQNGMDSLSSLLPPPPPPLPGTIQQSPHLEPGSGFVFVQEDSSIPADKFRVLSRTLWVGGEFVPTSTEQDLAEIFLPYGKIATIVINAAKFNAFIKMAERAQAERCKAELDRTTIQGGVMKVGWGCGFGPRECFDYLTGTSLIPLARLTETDRRWLTESVAGGFGKHEEIRGGVQVFEPNIEVVTADGKELPARGVVGAGRGRGRGVTVSTDGLGNAADSNRGRGRGRGGGGGGGGGRGRGNHETEGRGFGAMNAGDFGSGEDRFGNASKRDFDQTVDYHHHGTNQFINGQDPSIITTPTTPRDKKTRWA